ncbi:Protein BTN1 [Pseudocercospora fuligena]|uniref:Protein BTN n=1 Tax=Pseudocercospora fuligena TaxID=685502 RepID=A0A8H6RKH6_9PEZI|nr:Protein BTN1 [Pseudocercospora fuligena]
MLPMPGSPQSSWRLYRARIMSKFEGASARICIAFWLFGLINNIFYVIILTAALDLVGPSIPKATVLLSCIIPGLATKIVTPYFIHLIPYSLRVVLFVGFATCGMLAVALSPDTTDAAGISSKIAGIVLANISSGAGEVNFLALSHYYGPFSLAAWGSGTGAAGLLGAGAYTLATTTLGLSVHATLLSSVVLSFVMLATYFLVLPLGPLNAAERKESDYHRVESDEQDDDLNPITTSQSGLLDEPPGRSISPAYKADRFSVAIHDLKVKLIRAKSLVIPYMLPLFLVYLAEYTINQGVAPTLLFPLESSPFKRYREFYPMYGTIYQLGVFISRSSLPFIRIRSLYIPTWLQVLNLAILTTQAMSPFIPTVWFVFALILWEGLLGGLVYVSTFAAIREEVSEDEREFSLGAVTVSDSAGIFCAGLLGAGMETALCAWQVKHGRDWCRQR